MVEPVEGHRPGACLHQEQPRTTLSSSSCAMRMYIATSAVSGILSTVIPLAAASGEPAATSTPRSRSPCRNAMCPGKSG